MRQRSALGWALVAVALCVPAVMFWNWWSAMRPRQPELRVKGPAFVQSTPVVQAMEPSPAVSSSAPAALAAAPVPAAAQAPAPLAGAEAIEYNPFNKRDPTLSVADLRNLEKERMAREEVVREVQRKLPEPPKEPSIEERIQLYGIVATQNGVAALVNDGIYYKGDRVLGAAIREITASSVTFEHGGRRFVKRVSR